ncbi:MAG: 2-oxoacid:acceptor oxidoreductase family protein [Chloroflexi bacterium]|nr:2-oxoacid:acceptor oxidoreductase family protein [Chloroflexota bacterium]
MRQYNILICGVGGQGIMTLGTLLLSAGMPQGYRVIGAEYRGSAQRGGPINSTVRYEIFEGGDGSDERRFVYPGELPLGAANLLIAVEAAEALRNAFYLSRGATAVVNTYTIKPKTQARYPSVDELVAHLKETTDRVYTFPANQLSMERYGSYRMANAMLLGVALARSDLPVPRETIEGLLRSREEREALALGFNGA